MFTVVILVVCFGGVAVGRPSEPQCSQFDFVERTLEKVIKSEYKMVEFEERINNTLRKIEEITGSKIEQMSKLESDVTERLGQIEDVTESKIEHLAELEKMVNCSLATLNNKVEAAITDLLDKGSTKVAFNVYGLVDLSPGIEEVIRFTNVLINIGDGYDTDTGKFTSPVDGVFLFSTTICSNPNKYARFAITQNGNTNLVKTAHEDQDTHSCGSAIAVADLKAGDKVWVKITRSHRNSLYQDSARSNTFVGTLLG